MLATADRLDWFAERSDHLPLSAAVSSAGTAPVSEPPVSLVDKIRKLLAKAEGTDNANEAEAFSAKAAQLIAAHRIDPSTSPTRWRAVRRGCAGSSSAAAPTSGPGWRSLAAVAGNHDCEVVFETGPGGTTAMIAGFESDLDVTEVLYTSLHVQAANQMAAVRGAHAGGDAAMAPVVPLRLRQPRRRTPRRGADTGGRAAVAVGRCAGAASEGPLPDVLARGAGSASSPLARSGEWSRPGRRPRRTPSAGVTGTAPPAPSTSAVNVWLAGWRSTRRSALTDRGRAAVAAAEERPSAAPRPTSRSFVGGRVAPRRGDGRVVVAPLWAGRDRRSAAGWDAIVEARGVSDRVEIQLTDGQLSVATVAHELAHALAGLEHGHDDAFRAAYVDVASALAGVAPAAALAEAFAAMGIAAGDRRWPSPHRVAGDGFVVVSA